MNFKCRIYCTSKNELNFKGKPICPKANYKQLIDVLQPENTTFIERIQVLYKTLIKNGRLKPPKIKSLEFLISREIEEAEFVELIRKMKECGFNSTIKNNRIQFIDTKNYNKKPLYDYFFITSTRNKKCKYSKVNEYKYNTYILCAR